MSLVISPYIQARAASPRRGWPLGIILGVMLSTQAVRAEDSISRVEVKCEELDAESRAAIEARQLGELKTRGGAPGVLRLSCSPREVNGVWTVGDREIAARAMSRGEEEDPTELLHWLAAMLLETREDRARAGIDDVVKASPEAAQRSPVIEEPVEKPDEIPLESDTPSSSNGSPSASAKAPDEGASDAKREDSPSISAKSDSEELEESRDQGKREGVTLEFGIAAKYQHWGDDLVGSLGPGFSAALGLTPAFSLELEMSPQFSLRRSADFAATDWTGASSACVATEFYLGACAGGVLSVLQVRSPREVTTERAHSVTGGGEVTLRAFLDSEAAKYLAAVGLRALAQRREVRLDEAEIASIPHFQAIVSLGVRGQPFSR